MIPGWTELDLSSLAVDTVHVIGSGMFDEAQERQAGESPDMSPSAAVMSSSSVHGGASVVDPLSVSAVRIQDRKRKKNLATWKSTISKVQTGKGRSGEDSGEEKQRKQAEET